eukprot:CAMPEP_0206202720 /NCGR_PEP_ID=MMETSP0166-20121206/12358_1 /ASSEMBLY_ACC=CAM_ASM_000260 /TAXON_ID=95228 /ORGANISM="Vannella robusta, Strain DIVA3 518/3/11/1/6" /LENGTH=67 /DNA_ID=CAMNT_0053621733 /DNA_START=288 /DNA_END=487 /DNA_ORIENTATION=+
MDLRDDPEVLRQLAEKNMRVIEHSEGLQMAQQIKATGYFEVSSLTFKGVKALFEGVIITALHSLDPT